MAKHNGLRSKILKALEQNKEMYANEIAEAVGSTSRKVSNAIFAMPDVYRIKQHGTRNAKCIYSLKPIEGMIEEVIKPVKKEKPRRYVPEFKPMAEGGYSLYEGRQLAMVGPR